MNMMTAHHNFDESDVTLDLNELLPMNCADSDYKPNNINDDSEFEIFGVVTYVVHAVR